MAAWREPGRVSGDGYYCAVTAIGVGGGRAAFVIHFFDHGEPTRSRAWLYVAGTDEIGVVEVPFHVFPSGFVLRDRTVEHVWLSTDALALQTSPDHTLYMHRDGAWATLTGRDTVPGLPQRVYLLGDHLLWDAWRSVDDVRLVHARWGEPASIWYDISPDDVKGFGTDGVDLAWFQNYDRRPDGSYARTELWTVPYRRDVEASSPRLVRTVDVRSNAPAVGGGWVARRQTDPQRVEIFSLRDGTRRTFVPPGGIVADEPMYATETEIMFRGAGVFRFDPSMLPVDPEP